MSLSQSYQNCYHCNPLDELSLPGEEKTFDVLVLSGYYYTKTPIVYTYDHKKGTYTQSLPLQMYLSFCNLTYTFVLNKCEDTPIKIRLTEPIIPKIILNGSDRELKCLEGECGHWDYLIQ